MFFSVLGMAAAVCGGCALYLFEHVLDKLFKWKIGWNVKMNGDLILRAHVFKFSLSAFSASLFQIQEKKCAR
jgi:hypothetical protein